jgi:hypothetical protein
MGDVGFMSSLAISAIVFACVFGGTLFGMILRAILPDKHLSAESKDVIKLGMGLVGTMTALVLGLLIASAKSSFDTQRNGLAQLSANIILLDRALAHYGPESKDVRDMLREAVADTIERTWPQENVQPEQAETKTRTPGGHEGLYEKIQELAPKSDLQRTLQAQALRIGADIAQVRWLMFAQKGSSIPTPFLVVMVCWLTLILGSFSLFARSNAIVFSTLLVCALAVSSAIFLIMELDRPFEGMIQISSAPLRSAMEQLGR